MRIPLARSVQEFKKALPVCGEFTVERRRDNGVTRVHSGEVSLEHALDARLVAAGSLPEHGHGALEAEVFQSAELCLVDEFERCDLVGHAVFPRSSQIDISRSGEAGLCRSAQMAVGKVVAAERGWPFSRKARPKAISYRPARRGSRCRGLRAPPAP